MSVETSVFKLLDSDKDIYSIVIHNELMSVDAELLRKEVLHGSSLDYDQVYIDTRDVRRVDLTGINEIINSYSVLKNASKKLTLVYRKDSEMESWVQKSGLDKFIGTAILPAI